jgi:hypothetical protein
LNDCGEIKVFKQVLLSFSIWKYYDEVLCDLVLMHANHILLSKPWHYDRKTMYDGFNNIYSFVKDEKFVVVVSLCSKQVHEDQLKLRRDKRV